MLDISTMNWLGTYLSVIEPSFTEGRENFAARPWRAIAKLTSRYRDPFISKGSYLHTVVEHPNHFIRKNRMHVGHNEVRSKGNSEHPR